VEQPTPIEPAPLPPVLEKKRYHDLDALRAFAMLLGIVLHGMLSFFPIPMDIWPTQDLQQPMMEVPEALAAAVVKTGLPVPAEVSPFEFLLHAIHGFRMQLFFLVSGFFTAMLWRNRGLKALAKHRAKRILLPLAIALPLIWGAIIPVAIYGDAKKKEVDERKSPASVTDIFTALEAANTEPLQRLISAGANLEIREPFGGSTPLIVTALYGHTEAARLLLEGGAKVNAKNNDGDTALHTAAFFCHTELVDLLLEHGADINARNSKGGTALDGVAGPWKDVTGIYKFVDGLLKLNLDYEHLEATRPLMAETLQAAGGESAGKSPGQQEALRVMVFILFFFPVFHHLWFLYYLAWLVIGFLLLTWLLGKLKWKPLPDRLITSPWRWLWLLPLTFLLQLLMPDEFGPATAVGILPWPPILIYYAIFFAFGAICYGRKSFENKVGKHWPVHFGLAIPVLGVGLCLYWAGQRGPWVAACAVTYAWLMIFGFIGFFRHFFSGEHKVIRYVSDSSYWLYIAHLPVIMLVQAWISPWDIPAFPKFLIACALTTLPLLLIYEYGVRYTFVGTLLNGKRTRTGN